MSAAVLPNMLVPPVPKPEVDPKRLMAALRGGGGGGWAEGSHRSPSAGEPIPPRGGGRERTVPRCGGSARKG